MSATTRYEHCVSLYADDVLVYWRDVDRFLTYLAALNIYTRFTVLLKVNISCFLNSTVCLLIYQGFKLTIICLRFEICLNLINHLDFYHDLEI